MKIKKNQKKIVSLFLSVCMIFSLFSFNVYAASVKEASGDSNEPIVIYSDDNIVVDMCEVDGVQIIRELSNGRLVQRNTIYPDEPGVIHREFFDEGVITRSEHTKAVKQDTINVNDYGTLTYIPAPEAQVTPMAATRAGTIKYRALVGSGLIYYGLNCSYTTKAMGATTYTINGFLGKVVDLAAMLVSALNIPLKIASEYLKSLLTGLGATISGGVINEMVTDTVSADDTKYTWTLIDTTNAGHKKTVYGHKYYITDYKSAARGKNYYDGYVPKDWKTQQMAVWFHNEMFSYDSWDVVGWS